MNMKVIATALVTLGLAACGTFNDGYPGYKRGDSYPSGKRAGDGDDTVAVCHKGKKTLYIPRQAAEAHIGHGDWYGRC